MTEKPQPDPHRPLGRDAPSPEGTSENEPGNEFPGSRTGSAPPTKRLRVAVRKFGPFETAIAKQFASFKAATGSALELEIASLDLEPLTHTLFTEGGLKDGTWDVAFVVTDWLAEAIADGSLADLAPLMAAHPIPDYPGGWPPALTRTQQIAGRVYGIPYHDGPECLIYRRDWFADPAEQAAYAAQHGEPLAPPTTWEQFERVARFFTRPEQGRHGTVFAAYPDGHNTVYDFCLQLWSRGGELADPAGIPTLDTPQAAAALDFYRRLVEDRAVSPPGQEQIDSVQSGERFRAGAIAMMVNWFGFAAYCQQPDSPIKGRVGVAPIPAGPGGTGASLNVYWLLGVGSGSRRKNEAYAFVRHCATPAMDKLTTLEGGIGCRTSTWADPEVTAVIPFAGALPALHAQARELPRSRALPRLVHVVDRAVQRAILTDDPTAAILADAHAATADIRL